MEKPHNTFNIFGHFRSRRSVGKPDLKLVSSSVPNADKWDDEPFMLHEGELISFAQFNALMAAHFAPSGSELQPNLSPAHVAAE